MLSVSPWPPSAQPVARVSGRLAAADGRRLLSAAIMLTAADDSSTAAVPPEEVTILPDGSFTFGRVPPGRYQIRARGQSQPNGVTMFATFGLAVEGRDIANVTMTLEPGALLDGRLDIENRHQTATPPLSTLTVRAPLADGSRFGDALTGGVQRDGAFAIRGLVRGVHHVAVDGLGDRWTVRRVTIRGRDITDQPFDVAGEPLHDVRVTLVDAVSELAGEVRDEHDRPAADTPVLVFAVAPQFWIRDGRRLRLIRTDDSGRFRLRGLPPGAYLAVASPSVTDAKGRMPQNIERFRASATRLDITDDAPTVTISLRLADRSGRPATR
jgi:hypothetical protein